MRWRRLSFGLGTRRDIFTLAEPNAFLKVLFQKVNECLGVSHHSLIDDAANLETVGIGETGQSDACETSWNDVILHFDRFPSIELKGPEESWRVRES